MNSTSLYAAIDLGSNSFHMLVVREAAGSIQTLTRIKRKVRLAAGLNNDNHLSAEAMERGWQCLRLFAERLQDIPQPQIRVVATATLRLAVNAGEFIAKAQTILGCPVQVISGEEEARLIYQGVAHTTGGADQRLVVDIGGASTELVTGTGAQTTSLFSLSMGCVTWLERYFSDRNLAQENFDDAEKAARDVLRPVADELRFHGWKVCVGASGTVQALQEIMMAQGMDERITLAKLQQLKQRAIQCGRLEELEIEGLTLERALVFPSGLAILIAIFTELNIQSMTLAGGALREGLVYGMWRWRAKIMPPPNVIISRRCVWIAVIAMLYAGWRIFIASSRRKKPPRLSLLFPPASGAVSTISNAVWKMTVWRSRRKRWKARANGRRPQNCTVVGWH